MTETRLTTIAFDAYGTLFDSYSDRLWIDLMSTIRLEQSLQIHPAKLLREFTSEHDDYSADVRRTRGSPSVRTYCAAYTEHFRRIFERHGLAGDARRAADAVCALLSRSKAYSDVAASLETLGMHYRLAVLSNADDHQLMPCVDSAGLAFEVVLTSESVGVHKPHPLAYEALTRELDAMPSEILYVGDSPIEDVEGPSAFGMRTAWVNRRSLPNPRDARPDYEVPDLHVLTSRLLA